MFGVLIESRAGKQRRTAGALASVVLHSAIITGAVAVTAHSGFSNPAPVAVAQTIRYVPTPEPQPTTTSRQASSDHPVFVPKDAIVIRTLNFTPKDLPPITSNTTFDPSKVVIVGGSGPITHNPLDTVTAFAPGGVHRADNVDRIAALVDAPRPQYPETLRLAGVSGRVVVQFVVDTSGRVERESVHVTEASHARFENAVRDVLPRLRFTAAELAGGKVRMLVEMPFEFSITQR